jgi:hypothetical protein
VIQATQGGTYYNTRPELWAAAHESAVERCREHSRLSSEWTEGLSSAWAGLDVVILCKLSAYGMLNAGNRLTAERAGDVRREVKRAWGVL